MTSEMSMKDLLVIVGIALGAVRQIAAALVLVTSPATPIQPAAAPHGALSRTLQPLSSA